MNKIGTIDIIKSYLGNKELTANNAFIGEIELIKDTPTPPTGAKYIKVDDLTTLQDGDEFIFAKFTGQVVTDAFNLSHNSTTVATNQGAQLSDENITINNGEFVETELDKIQHATYHASDTLSYQYDAKPLILKKVDYDSSSFLLVYNNNGTDYILTLTSISKNRKLKLVSPIPASPSNLQLWNVNNYNHFQVINSTTSSDYSTLYASSNTYGSFWLSNYRKGFNETWQYDIYKKV